MPGTAPSGRHKNIGSDISISIMLPTGLLPDDRRRTPARLSLNPCLGDTVAFRWLEKTATWLSALSPPMDSSATPMRHLTPLLRPPYRTISGPIASRARLNSPTAASRSGPSWAASDFSIPRMVTLDSDSRPEGRTAGRRGFIRCFVDREENFWVSFDSQICRLALDPTSHDL